MKIKYICEIDDMEFDTADECIAYESKKLAFIKDTKFYKDNVLCSSKTLKDLDNNYQRDANKVIFPSIEAKEWLIKELGWYEFESGDGDITDCLKYRVDKFNIWVEVKSK